MRRGHILALDRANRRVTGRLLDGQFIPAATYLDFPPEVGDEALFLEVASGSWLCLGKNGEAAFRSIGFVGFDESEPLGPGWGMEPDGGSFRLASPNFPGFGLGGPGFGIDGVTGNCEFNDAIFRGIINASGGPNLLENGDAEVDISGVTESDGTLSRETDTDETHNESLGAFKLVTASESTERFLEWDPVDIDPKHPLYRVDAYPRGSHALNRSKVAIVWRESDDTEIGESVGEYVTIGTGYGRVVAQGSPPAVQTGFTDFQPNEDVAFAGSGASGVPNNTAGQRYQNVDEVALDTADYVEATGVNSAVHAWRANVGSGNLAGKNIVAVEVLTDAARITGAGGKVKTLITGASGSTDHNLSAVVTQYDWRWDVNPSTGLPWTIADVEAFDTTSAITSELVDNPSSGTRRMARHIFRVHWQEDIPAPTRASVRVYLDPEQTAVTTWRVDDVELRTVSSVTAALLRTAESGRRWEGDSVDSAQHRYYNDDDELIGTVDAHTSHGELANYEMPDQASDQTGVTSSSTTIVTTGGVATEITWTVDAERVVEVIGSAILYKGAADTGANTVLEIRDGSNVNKRQANVFIAQGGQQTPTVRERIVCVPGTTYTRRLRFYTQTSFINCLRTGAPEAAPWIRALDRGAPR